MTIYLLADFDAHAFGFVNKIRQQKSSWNATSYVLLMMFSQKNKDHFVLRNILLHFVQKTGLVCL